MKKLIFSILAISTIIFTACNNGGAKNDHEGHDVNNMNNVTSQHSKSADDKVVKEVSATYLNIDAKAAASFGELVGHYLHIKNALAKDDGNEAAIGAKAMELVFNTIDKSLLTSIQKKAYDEIEAGLKEHAAHIARNGENISHQREQFSGLSVEMYKLVKAFGGGRDLYHDHCPMYNDNKGAMWLSEMKEVKNPYFGSQMLKCGTVEEVIK